MFRKLFGGKKPEPAQSTPQMVDPKLGQNISVSAISESPYPLHDELGRLLCRGCGMPYRSWTVRGIIQQAAQIKEDPKDFEQINNCTICGKLSKFPVRELLGGNYRPTNQGIPAEHKTRSTDLISDKAGFLKCSSCNHSLYGFSVKGSIELLTKAQQKSLCVACENCRTKLFFTLDELRTAEPKVPPPSVPTLEMQPDTPGYIDMLKPIALTQAGRFAEALTYVDNALREVTVLTHPYSQNKEIQARLFAYRGTALLGLQKFKEAKESAETSLGLNPDDAMALYVCGYVCNHNSDFSSALKYLEHSYRVDPSREHLLFELAFAHNAMKQYDVAIDILKDAITQYPGNYIFHREIAYSYLAIGQPKLSRDHYERGFALCAPNLVDERAEMASNMGAGYMQEGNRDEAGKWFTRAWLLATPGSQLHNKLAALFTQK